MKKKRAFLLTFTKEEDFILIYTPYSFVYDDLCFYLYFELQSVIGTFISGIFIYCISIKATTMSNISI